MLRWHSRIGENHRLFMVEGTELACAVVPNTSHRFVLCELRTFVRENDHLVPDRIIAIRDAASVSDAEVAKRIRPRIVARFAGVDDALAYCRKEAEVDNELARPPKAA
jgi:hypothetical protein